MKQATRTRTKALALVVAATGLGLAGVQAAFSQPSVAAPTITSAPPAVTSARTATFAFTGPAKATFKCRLDTGAFVACSSPVSYTSLVDGSHQFQVKASTSAGESAATSSSWTVDTVAPPAPVITDKPTDPTTDSNVSFRWSDVEAGTTFQCSLENGAWTACSSPRSWQLDTGNSGQHQFAVRALDAAGNASAPASYSFKYQQDTGGKQPFAISGSASGLLIGVWKPITVTVTNSNKQAIYVTSLTVAVDPAKDPAGCPSGTNLELRQPDVSSTNRLTVGPGASVTLPAQGVSTPEIRLKNLPSVNQDACKGTSFALSYSGTATN
jgi:hypothetical protein